MIHFGVRDLSYSVKFNESGYKYGEQKYIKMFSVSFLNNSITIKYKPSITKIDAFDLFSIEKQRGYKTQNHFATLHAGREYVIKMSFIKRKQIFTIDLSEANNLKYIYSNPFSYPNLSVGFISQKKNNDIKIKRLQE